VSDRPLFTNEAALAGAKEIGLSIANAALTPTPRVGKIRLFDGTLIPDLGTTHADLVAKETTLIGYPVGGYSLTAFSSPKFAPLGGAVITSNLVDVTYASGEAVVIGGYWVEDDATPTPRVREVFIYDPPRSLAQIGDGWPVAVQLAYGLNFGV